MRILAVLFAVLFFAGCGAEPTSTSAGAAAVPPPASIREAGEISFCSDMSYPPMEFFEGERAVGVDVELGEDFAQRMGVRARFQNMGYDGIIAALLTNRCDAIFSSMTVTPERSEQVDFVEYAAVGSSMLVAKGNPQGIATADDLHGRSVAVQIGTTSKQLLDDLNAKSGKGAISIQTFPKDTAAANALRAGRVDVWVSDTPPIAYYAQQNPDLFEIAGEQLRTAPIGVAVRPRDGELRASLQTAVDAAYADGSVRKILAAWRLSDIALR